MDPEGLEDEADLEVRIVFFFKFPLPIKSQY